jgi:hypothetical protein
MKTDRQRRQELEQLEKADLLEGIDTVLRLRGGDEEQKKAQRLSMIDDHLSVKWCA